MSRATRFLFASSVVCGLLTSHVQAEANRRSISVHSSRNFQLMTDLPSEEADELLGRLERMLQLVSAYWGRPNRKTIRMFVINDFSAWPKEQLSQMSPDGLTMVRGGGGLTITSVRGIVGGPKLDANAIVYATSARGTPQHEAIHAYCGITFGELGPVWYSEGMAEVGKYWRENDSSVNATPDVIRHLRGSTPKPLNEIVNNPLDMTGDSWKNYAWRWALCHLLGFNSNYSPRFKPLGLSFLSGRKVSFWTVYGNQAEEIEFEYRLFLEHLVPGYRCDLCSWDWKTRFKRLRGKARATSKIQSNRGWQASRVIVTEGQHYQIEPNGEWSVAPDTEAVGAAGDANGRGTLVGVVFQDYELSDEFEIGDAPTFTAPATGKLFLRCRDDWSALADNRDALSVEIKLAPEQP